MARVPVARSAVRNVNYRSLVPGGYFSSTPFDRRIPVSIRCNNPGAINGASWERTYPGYVDTVETTPGNKTTIFEAPEFGVAVWWELLRRYANAGATTIKKIITKYGGGQDYSAYVGFVTDKTGFSASKVISLDNDADLLAFGRAMFWYEAGRPSPLHDAQINYGVALGRVKGRVDQLAAPEALSHAVADAVVMYDEALVADGPAAQPPFNGFTLETVEGVMAIQRALIAAGYLDPPADGGYGPVTKWALARFAENNGLRPSEALSASLIAALESAQPIRLNLGSDLAGKILKAMQTKNHWIARDSSCVNIVYVEGIDSDGTPNDNRNNVFNDMRYLIRVKADGTPAIIGSWEATTEPGRYWTLHPMNPNGAFHIAFGQYKAWVKGVYHTQDALVQVGMIKGYRDPNKTFKRDFHHPVEGDSFGVHHHWGYDLSHDDLGRSSAGCLVGRSTQGHRDFMAIVMGDARYRANPAYRFMSTIMTASDL